MLPTRLILSASLLGTGWFSPAAAQESSPMAMFAEEMARSDSLDATGEFLAALTVLESILERAPNHVTAGWRAAQVAVTIGVLAPNYLEANEWFERGEHHARRALHHGPQSLDALYWLVAAMGKRALHYPPPLPTVRLARAVLDSAKLILTRDSLHAGAHNVVGVLNYEVMALSRVKRFIARRIVDRRTIGKASWAIAEWHLRRAIDLDPRTQFYRLDLAKLLARRDGTEEAIALLRGVLAAPVTHPTDDIFQREARELLNRLTRLP